MTLRAHPLLEQVARPVDPGLDDPVPSAVLGRETRNNEGIIRAGRQGLAVSLGHRGVEHRAAGGKDQPSQQDHHGKTLDYLPASPLCVPPKTQDPPNLRAEANRVHASLAQILQQQSSH